MFQRTWQSKYESTERITMNKSPTSASFWMPAKSSSRFGKSHEWLVTKLRPSRGAARRSGWVGDWRKNQGKSRPTCNYLKSANLKVFRIEIKPSASGPCWDMKTLSSVANASGFDVYILTPSSRVLISQQTLRLGFNSVIIFSSKGQKRRISSPTRFITRREMRCVDRTWCLNPGHVFAWKVS
jgi:hypothetical protein